MTELKASDTLHKTPLGLAMIKDRDRTLDFKSRTLLILADGSKTVHDLSKLSPDASHVMQLLQLPRGRHCIASYQTF
jgi:hypothetical protein